MDNQQAASSSLLGRPVVRKVRQADLAEEGDYGNSSLTLCHGNCQCIFIFYDVYSRISQDANNSPQPSVLWQCQVSWRGEFEGADKNHPQLRASVLESSGTLPWILSVAPTLQTKIPPSCTGIAQTPSSKDYPAEDLVSWGTKETEIIIDSWVLDGPLLSWLKWRTSSFSHSAANVQVRFCHSKCRQTSMGHFIQVHAKQPEDTKWEIFQATMVAFSLVLLG